MNNGIICILLILIAYFTQMHLHNLPPNTVAIEEFYSLRKRKYIYRVSKVGRLFVSIKPKFLIKIVELPSEQRFYGASEFLDAVKCTYLINYNLELLLDEKLTKYLYSITRFNENPKQNNDYLIKAIDLKVEYELDKIMLNEYSYHFNDNVIKENFEKIMNKICEYMGGDYKLKVTKVFSDTNMPVTYKPEKRLKLDIEKLNSLNYNLQQINQILKGYNDNIFLDEIDPIVPERIFRLIRDKYNANKEKLDKLISELKTNTKTQENINKICEEIINL